MQAKGAVRKKGNVKRKNAFSVMMEIRGGLKLLGRVTRGKLTLWEEEEINGKQMIRDS